MAKGKRKFVLEITETTGLTEDDLTKALSRLSSSMHTGRSSIESGRVFNAAGDQIGYYGWRDQLTSAREAEGSSL